MDDSALGSWFFSKQNPEASRPHRLWRTTLPETPCCCCSISTAAFMQLWAVTPPPMTTIRGRIPKWVYGIGVQCYQLHRSILSPVLRELIDSWRVGGRNKIIILIKSFLFQNLEKQIPSAKSVKTHLQKVKKTQPIENYHLHKWRHYIKMLNQPGSSGSRTKPTSGVQPSFLLLLL